MAPCRVLFYLSCFLVVTILISAAADRSAVRVPDYMLRLYEENLGGRARQHPEIIRSFTGQLIDGVVEKAGHSNSSIVHYLSFQAAPLPADETLSRAQLRLRKLILRHHRRHHDYLLQVYVLRDGVDSRNWYLVESQLVDGKRVMWETLDVTKAVSWWQWHRGAQILQVTVEPVGRPGTGIDIDFSLTGLEESEPLLLVYSADNSFNNNSKSRLKNNRKHKREIDVEELEEESNSIWDGAITGRPSAPATPLRRKKGRNNPCRRRPMYVDFAAIRYDSWIIAPRGYEAYECVGRCTFPMSDHQTPTKHAIIQSLVHAANPDRTTRPCCVPTRLEPISLLYVDENGVVTYKYNYEDMVVAECGCR